MCLLNGDHVEILCVLDINQEIIILSMYLINKKLCNLILCNEIENSFFIINAMQDLLQRSRNTLYFIAIRTAEYQYQL